MYPIRIKNSLEYLCRRAFEIISKHSRAVSLLILFIPLLQGCAGIPVPVPWHGEPPYDKNTIEKFLIPNSTTHSDVVRYFGYPATSWNEGRLLLYAGFEKTHHDVLSQASAGNRHYIALEFNNKGLLKRYDYFVDEQCTSWGLCFYEPLDMLWSYSKFLGFSDQYLVGPAVSLKASKEIDELVKNFDRITGKCAIYMYYSGQIPSPRRPVLCRENQECRELKPGSFIYWSQDSKNSLLNFLLGQFRLGIVNIDVINKVQFQTSCKSEGLIFARVFYKKTRWYGKFEVQVEYEDDEHGTESVSKLWLMQD